MKNTNEKITMDMVNINTIKEMTKKNGLAFVLRWAKTLSEYDVDMRDRNNDVLWETYKDEVKYYKYDETTNSLIQSTGLVFWKKFNKEFQNSYGLLKIPKKRGEWKEWIEISWHNWNGDLHYSIESSSWKKQMEELLEDEKRELNMLKEVK